MSAPGSLSVGATATDAPMLVPTAPGFVRGYHLLPTEFALSDIALRRMKVSRLADLNDPFELSAANLGEKRIREAVRGFKRDLHERAGLLSFSKEWKSPVLWSHYAAKHHGMCLGFDLRKNQAMEVVYEAERILPEIDDIDGPNPSSSPEFVRRLLCTKYTHWSYEQEFRVFVRLDETTKEDGLFYYAFSSDLLLRQVILGHSCEIPLERVRELVRNIYGDEVRVFKARECLNNYRC